MCNYIVKIGLFILCATQMKKAEGGSSGHNLSAAAGFYGAGRGLSRWTQRRLASRLAASDVADLIQRQQGSSNVHVGLPEQLLLASKRTEYYDAAGNSISSADKQESAVVIPTISSNDICPHQVQPIAY